MLIRIIHSASDVGRRLSFVIRNSSFTIRHSSSDGFSLLELTIAMVIMVIALVPIMDSITASFKSAPTGEENTLLSYYARQKMEDIIAQDFNSINISVPTGTPTALSDTVTVSGKTLNRNVYVALYDGNGDTILDPDLKKITVVIEGIQIDTLLSYY